MVNSIQQYSSSGNVAVKILNNLFVKTVFNFKIALVIIAVRILLIKILFL